MGSQPSIPLTNPTKRPKKTQKKKHSTPVLVEPSKKSIIQPPPKIEDIIEKID